MLPPANDTSEHKGVAMEAGVSHTFIGGVNPTQADVDGAWSNETAPNVAWRQENTTVTTRMVGTSEPPPAAPGDV